MAEVRPASATSLFIFGVAPGRTTVAALDASGGRSRSTMSSCGRRATAQTRQKPLWRAPCRARRACETLQNGLTSPAR